MTKSFHLSVEQLKENLVKSLIDIGEAKKLTGDRAIKQNLDIARQHINIAVDRLYSIMYPRGGDSP
jgi:hypothetical protein